MSEAALDAKKWSRCIFDSHDLRELLKDRDFIKEQVEFATMLYKKKPVSPLLIVEALSFILEQNDRVMNAIERIPNIGNDSTTRKIILHWYAIMVYVTAREFSLIVTHT
jgi:hypothetical protein